jgi:hypothetical protein
MGNVLMNRNQVLFQAIRYDFLANYYKYVHPTKHVYYYQKHLEALHQYFFFKTTQSYRMIYKTKRGMTKFRLLHASPDTPAVDIYLNGRLTIKNITYKEMSSYLQIPAGSYLFEIYPFGKFDKPLTKEMIFFMPGVIHTIVCCGPMANLDLIPFIDASYVSAGEAKVRFVHVSPDAPSFDLAFKEIGDGFKHLSYTKASPYKSVRSGKYQCVVKISGTADEVFVHRNLKFDSDTAYSLFAIGFSNGTPSLELLLSQDG